jgi:predicted RND superfamily exporter protein
MKEVHVLSKRMGSRQDVFEWSGAHPILIIGITAVLTLVLGFFAAGITMDSNIHDLVPEDDSVKRILEQHGFEDGTYRMLILAIEGDKKEVFDLEGLQSFEEVIGEHGNRKDYVIGKLTPSFSSNSRFGFATSEIIC